MNHKIGLHTQYHHRTTSKENIVVWGDIHGNLDLFTSALNWGMNRGFHSIFVGDLPDRGPHDAKCFALYLHYLVSGDRDRLTILPGNHEQITFGCLTNYNPNYIGTACIPSNGLGWWTKYVKNHRDLEDRDIAMACVLDALTNEAGLDRTLAQRMLEQACDLWKKNAVKMYWQNEDIFVIHAGVSPDGVKKAGSLAQWVDQFHILDLKSEHPLWIREKFLHAPNQNYGRIVIHGHTTTGKAEFVNNDRINVDANAKSTGILQGYCITKDKLQRISIDRNGYNPDSDYDNFSLSVIDRIL